MDVTIALYVLGLLSSIIIGLGTWNLRETVKLRIDFERTKAEDTAVIKQLLKEVAGLTVRADGHDDAIDGQDRRLQVLEYEQRGN